MNKELAKLMVEYQIVKLDPRLIKIGSGIKTGIKSPIFCDVKALQSIPELRDYIVDSLTQKIRSYPEQPEAIAGVVSGVIPFSVIVADRMRLPHYSVNEVPKMLYGTKKVIDGKVQDGIRILLIEDVVTAGKGSTNAIMVLRNEGALIDKCLTIVNYGTEASEGAYKEIGCELDYLTTIERVIYEHLKSNQPAKKVLVRIESFINKYIPQGERITELISKFK